VLNPFLLKADMRQCQGRSELFCKVAGAISHFSTGTRSLRFIRRCPAVF
jgi:hypothetical protein